jgi:hypothetical protein
LRLEITTIPEAKSRNTRSFRKGDKVACLWQLAARQDLPWGVVGYRFAKKCPCPKWAFFYPTTPRPLVAGLMAVVTYFGCRVDWEPDRKRYEKCHSLPLTLPGIFQEFLVVKIGECWTRSCLPVGRLGAPYVAIGSPWRRVFGVSHRLVRTEEHRAKLHKCLILREFLLDTGCPEG